MKHNESGGFEWFVIVDPDGNEFCISAGQVTVRAEGVLPYAPTGSLEQQSADATASFPSSRESSVRAGAIYSPQCNFNVS